MSAKGRKSPHAQLGQGKIGAPRILVRRHILEVEEDTQEWLEEFSTKLLAAHEGSQIAKGFLSTNVGALSLVLAGITFLLAYPSTRPLVLSFIEFTRTQIGGIASDVLSGIFPGPAAIVDSVEDAADEVAKKAREAAEELARRIEEFRRLQCPEGEHPELVPTPAGLIVQCVPDEPAL